MPDSESKAAPDDLPTVLALGVVAYVSETLLHEAVGHGGVCLASGGRITAVAPLWMRCSVDSHALVAAGPLSNFVAAVLLLVWLWNAPPRGSLGRELLWLTLSFNALVASGYLLVGGLSGFGDWGVLIQERHPAWLFRGGISLLGAASYYGSLRILAALYWTRVDAAGLRSPRLLRRAFVPTAGAAVVAIAAELAGRRFDLGIGLAVGCTLVVGWSLTRLRDFPGAINPTAPSGEIKRSVPWIVAGLALALFFVFAVGPVLAF